MLVEDLKTLVADLFKQSEEAVPGFGDGAKKEWMARRLDSIIDENGKVLQRLLKFKSLSNVVDYLEMDYSGLTVADQDFNPQCGTQTKKGKLQAPTAKHHSEEVKHPAKKRSSTTSKASLMSKTGTTSKAGVTSKAKTVSKAKTASKVKTTKNVPAYVVEEEIILIEDGGCGC